MAEYEKQIGGLATAFAQVSSRATAASNLQRIKIAENNVSAANQQIDLEKRTDRNTIARELAQYQGSQAAARAFRGSGPMGSGFASNDAATAQAADQSALVEANASAKKIAAQAANQVQLDDPVLAAIQGGIEGLNLGTQLANALLQEATVKQRQSSQQIGTTGAGGGPTLPTFQNTITSYLDIPGLNLGDFLTGLNLNAGN